MWKSTEMCGGRERGRAVLCLGIKNCDVGSRKRGTDSGNKNLARVCGCVAVAEVFARVF